MIAICIQLLNLVLLVVVLVVVVVVVVVVLVGLFLLLLVVVVVVVSLFGLSSCFSLPGWGGASSGGIARGWTNTPIEGRKM